MLFRLRSFVEVLPLVYGVCASKGKHSPFSFSAGARSLFFFCMSGFCPEVLLFVWNLRHLLSLSPPRGSGSGVSESQE